MGSSSRGLPRWTLSMSALLPIVGAVLVAAGVAFAQTLSECQTARENQRRTARANAEQEMGRCREDRRCVTEARTRMENSMEQIDEATSACRARARSQMKAEPPPYLHWKPGDPSPQAKDGRLYLMSCGGKVLGLYKHGSAREVELKTYPGNCIPVEDWGPAGPPEPSTSDEGKPCTLGNGVDGYRPGWIWGGVCQPAH